MDIEQKFWGLCKEAQAEDEKDYGITPKFGEKLHNILQLVMDNPEYEENFKKYFIDIGLNETKFTEWIILYCMRELRYSEVQEAINKKFNDLGGIDGAPGLMNYVSHVNWTYEDTPWEDADFFKYHWEKEHPGEPWPLEA